MGNRQENHSNKRALVLTLAAAALVTIFCAYRLLKIPADIKNAFLFGLSKERLLMVSGFGILFLLNLLCLVFRNKFSQNISGSSKFRTICSTLMVVSLFFLLMPEYRFADGAAYFTRLKPYILWIFLTSLLFWLFTGYVRDRFAAVRDFFHNVTAEKKFILPVLLVIIAGILFVEITGLGKTVEISLWNKNGIPLQSIQLFTAFVIFALFMKTGVFLRLNDKKLFNFLIIWAISGLVWSLAPKMDHFFAPGPYLPDQQYYPYSDASTYDIAAQTAVNGWGFNLKRTVLKPALVFISFLTHIVSGNNYDLSMLVQSELFAVLPAVMYLFGSAIGGTGCGFLSAAFSILKEWNALNTHAVLTIHSRLIMSEFLIQIILASFCYAVFRWLKRDGKETFYAALSGGMAAMGIFTRYNFLAFIPAVLVLLLIAYRKNIKQLAKPILFFSLTILLTAAPLFYRDTVTQSGMLNELSYTVNNVLIRQRFNEKKPFGEDEQETVSSEQMIFSTTETESNNPDLIRESASEKTQIRTEEQKPENPEQQQKIYTADTASKKQTEIPVSDSDEKVLLEEDLSLTKESAPENDNDNILKKQITQNSSEITKSPEASENRSDEFNTSQITQENSNINTTVKLTPVPSIFNHSFHNLIASVLTLPMEFTFQNLENIYTQSYDGLWRDNWQGDFSLCQWFMLAFWCLMGSLAAGMLIRYHGIAGFSVVYFWVVYAFSIGFSRSSGGRYVVPMNWFPMLLLSLCCTLVCSKGKLPLSLSPASNNRPVWKTAAVMAAFTAFFTAMVLFENLMPSKTTAAPDGDLTVLRERLGDPEEINWDLVEEQTKNGTMTISHGVVVYPRFYYFKTGEHSSSGSTMMKEYSRMSFMGINKDLNSGLYQDYMMPHKEIIDRFPQDSVFRALSCSSEFGYQDVLAVTVESPDGKIYTYMRDPLPSFSCPVPEPVCLSVENCY